MLASIWARGYTPTGSSDRIKLCALAAQDFSPDGFVVTSNGETHLETFMGSLFPIHRACRQSYL
jgi:hypothetical protein